MTMAEIYVQFSDCGQHIRKWSREPFESGEQFTKPNDTDECICPKCGIRHGGRSWDGEPTF
jgi:hypothetical protein